jgi:DNA repair exonuclease SbcCD ATPase subunit
LAYSAGRWALQSALAGIGTSGGFLYDLAHLGVGQDFFEQVGQSLRPGNAAVVAEVQEDWTLPVDAKMEALGGVVLRRTRRDSLDRQVEWDITTLRAEIDELESEYDKASIETKTKLQEKINTARANLQTTVNRIQARLETSQEETKAKIDSLQQQVTKAREERKATLEKRIAELKAEQKRRNALLKQVGQFIKETLQA